MVNYKNGFIYRLDGGGKTYIGSSCEPSCARRLAKHVNNYNCYINGTAHYVTSFDVIDTGDYKITLVEKYPCNDRDELRKREQYWIDNIECINKTAAYRSNEQRKKDETQRYYDKREEILEQKKLYYKDHQCEILEKKKIYRDDNRDKINERWRINYHTNKSKE